jgi:hypothetical protein
MRRLEELALNASTSDADLTRAFLEFGKSYMESELQSTGKEMYRKEAEEIDRCLNNFASFVGGVDRAEKAGVLNFSTDPNMASPEYRAAKEKYEAYVQLVEDGKHEDSDQMIALYKALLETVPPGTLLARKIEEEIEGHEVDRISDSW